MARKKLTVAERAALRAESGSAPPSAREALASASGGTDA
jgi:hypothetical protein